MKQQQTKICPHCGREYSVEMVRQIPGCRDTEEERCPYCEEKVQESMEWEFYTRRI